MFFFLVVCGMISVNIVSGTVYVWPMHSITNNKVDGDIPGTVHGGVTVATKTTNPTLEKTIVPSYVRCDGSSGTYIDLGDAKRDECWGDPDNCPNGFTYTLWIQSKDVSSYGYIFSNGGQTVSSWGVSLYIQSGYMYAKISTKSKSWYSSGTSQAIVMAQNVWYHIALVWDSTNGAKLYRDAGALRASISQSVRSPALTTTSWTNFHLCKPNNADNYYGNFYISEMIFMDYAVDINYVIAHMQSFQQYDTTEDCGPDTTPGPIPLRCVQAMWFAVGCLTSGAIFPATETQSTWWMERPRVWDLRYDHINYRKKADADVTNFYSHCMGAATNIALLSNGAGCTTSSAISGYGCGNALQASLEWATVGEGAGSWINITFGDEFVVDNIRLIQRIAEVEQSDKLTFLFSDGFKNTMRTIQRPGHGISHSGWDAHHLPGRVTASWMRIYVDTVYTKVNNGFAQVQIFETPEPCLPNPCQNGGTCKWNKIYKYLCYCTKGFSGYTCDRHDQNNNHSYIVHDDSFLSNSVISTETIRHDLECSGKCVKSGACLAYNVYTDSNGKRTCSLNTNSPSHDSSINLSTQSNSAFYTELPEDCESVRGPDGVYTIRPRNTQLVVKVKCEGGWTVIARRTSRDLLFNQTWHAYKYGFGSVSGDHWLGNEYVHYLTNQANYSIRMEEKSILGLYYYADYDKFLVGSEEEKYKLHQWTDYHGNLTDKETVYSCNVGMFFTTIDSDNDSHSNGNCAAMNYMGGGWWHCACTAVSLTSHYPQDAVSCGQIANNYCMKDRGIKPASGNDVIDAVLVAATMKIRKA